MILDIVNTYFQGDLTDVSAKQKHGWWVMSWILCSVAVVANISVRSPQQLIIFIMRKAIFRVNVSQKYFFIILKTKPLILWCMVSRVIWKTWRCCISRYQTTQEFLLLSSVLCFEPIYQFGHLKNYLFIPPFIYLRCPVCTYRPSSGFVEAQISVRSPWKLIIIIMLKNRFCI